jgi:cytochrome c2
MKRIAAVTLVALAVISSMVTASAQDVSGEALYRQRCSACHGIPGRPSPAGPDLTGIIGRKAGSTAFKHSPALKNAKITWNRANLDTFLAGPTQMVPGVRMMYRVTDASQRRALVAYLATFRR